MLEDPAYQEEMMNSIGAQAFIFLTEQQLKTYT